MQQTIKTYRRIGALACFGAVLLLGSCNGCKGDGGKTGSDTAKKDSAMVMKKDSDTTAVKPAVDSSGNPPSHLPKKDTATKARPLDRKT